MPLSCPAPAAMKPSVLLGDRDRRRSLVRPPPWVDPRAAGPEAGPECGENAAKTASDARANPNFGANALRSRDPSQKARGSNAAVDTTLQRAPMTAPEPPDTRGGETRTNDHRHLVHSDRRDLALCRLRLRRGSRPEPAALRVGDLAGHSVRACGAHLNALETFPWFAAAVIVAHMVGGPSRTADVLAVVYVLLRIGHMAAYVAGRQPLRSAAFGLAQLCRAGDLRLAAVPLERRKPPSRGGEERGLVSARTNGEMRGRGRRAELG